MGPKLIWSKEKKPNAGAFYLRSKAQWCEIVLCSPQELYFSTSTIGLRCLVEKRIIKKKKKRPIGLVLAAFEFCLNNGNISSLKDSIIIISNTF